MLGVDVVADDTVDQAQEDLTNGNTQSAVVRLKARLDEVPDDAAARLLLGNIYLDIDDATAAAQEFERALAAGAKDSDALIPLARALLAQGASAQLLERIPPPTDGEPQWQGELLGLRGAALLATGETDAAGDTFEQASQLAPDLALPLVGLAQLATINEDDDRARTLLERAIAAEPSSAQAWEAFGSLEYRQQRFEEAAAAFGEALEREPDQWLLRYRRALSNVEAKAVEAVRSDFEALRPYASTFPGILYLQGRLALLEDDPETAAQALEEFLGVAPGDPRARYYTALALLQSGRPAQAEERLIRLQAARPNNPMVAVLLTLTRLQDGNPEGAEEAIRPFAERPNATPPQLVLLRRAVLAQGRNDEALTLTARLADMQPESIEPRIALAQLSILSGDYAAALKHLKQAKSLAPDSLPTRLLTIRALLGVGDIEAAKRESRETLEQAPDDPVAQAIFASTLALDGDTDGAKAAFERALALNPSFTGAALALAALEAGNDRFDSAQATLESLLQADAGNTEAILALAELDRRDGDDAASSKRLHDALDRNPRDLRVRITLAQERLTDGDIDAGLRLLQDAPPDQAQTPALLRLRGRAELASDRADLAMVSFKRLTQQQPKRPQGYFLMAATAATIGDTDGVEQHLIDGLDRDQAQQLRRRTLARILAALPDDRSRENLLERLLAAAPTHPTVVTAHAGFALNQGGFEIALPALQQLYDDKPDDPVRLADLALAHERAGQIDRAFALLENWTATHPESSQPRMLLAEMALRANRIDTAKAQYRSILDTAAQNPIALNNLAMLLADEDPQSALPLAEQAYALRPQDPSFIDTLGTILLNLGQTRRALPLLAEAHAGSDDPSIGFRYAKALAATGQTRDARALLLEINLLPFPEKAQAEALLQKLR